MYSAVWSMFYASVVSMQFHPGADKPRSLKECAGIADEMLLEYLLRFEEVPCRGSVPR